MKLKKEKNLTYLFITHDLSVTEYICDRIAVMYLGRLVELCKSEELYANTLHPYTEALLSAIPVADLDKKTKRIILEGDVPSPVNPPSGCPFHPRCPKAKDICKSKVPPLKRYSINDNDHYGNFVGIWAPNLDLYTTVIKKYEEYIVAGKSNIDYLLH
jgi:oligopeptide/dipeptide ABC transporter ATP-binding protein